MAPPPMLKVCLAPYWLDTYDVALLREQNNDVAKRHRATPSGQASPSFDHSDTKRTQCTVARLTAKGRVSPKLRLRQNRPGSIHFAKGVEIWAGASSTPFFLPDNISSHPMEGSETKVNTQYLGILYEWRMCEERRRIENKEHVKRGKFYR